MFHQEWTDLSTFQNKYLFYFEHILHTHTHTHTHKELFQNIFTVPSPVKRQAPATSKICKYGFTVSRQLRNVEAGRRTIPRTREDEGQWNSRGSKGTVQCMGVMIYFAVILHETQGVDVTKVIRREVDENCALLGYYAASSGCYLSMFRDNLSVPSSRFSRNAEK
jgi:hypothetical protein